MLYLQLCRDRLQCRLQQGDQGLGCLFRRVSVAGEPRLQLLKGVALQVQLPSTLHEPVDVYPAPCKRTVTPERLPCVAACS